MTLLDQSKELMSRVEEILFKRNEIVQEMSPLDAHLLIMYSRIVSLYRGVAVLLSARLAAEALILSRQMFTESLHMMEMEREEANRYALLLGMYNDSISQWEHMAKMDRSLREGGEEDLQIRDHVAKERKKIKDAQRRYSVGKLRKFGGWKQLAKDNGRLDESMDFEFTQAVVHQPFIAQLGRVKNDPELLRIHSQDSDDRQIANAGAFAMTSVLHAHKAVGSIFGWMETQPEQIDSLLAEVRDAFAREADES